MGKMLLLIVTSFIIISSTYIVSLNKTNETSNDLISEQARITATSSSAYDAVNYIISELRKNHSENVNDILQNNSIWLENNKDKVVNVKKTIILQKEYYDSIKVSALIKQKDKYRKVTANFRLKHNLPHNALGLYGNNADIDIQTGRVSGYNHDLSGDEISGTSQYGITTNGGAIAQSLRNEYAGKTWKGDNPIIGKEDGEGANDRQQPSIKDGESVNVEEYMQKIDQLNNITRRNGTLSGDFGTNSPNGEIVYSEGNTSLSSDVKGKGILVVEGDLHTNGHKLNWDGAVICNNPSKNTQVVLQDSSMITGSLISGGIATDHVSVEAKGKEVKFDIGNDVVTPKEDFRAKITALGSNFAKPDGTKCPTNSVINIGSEEQKTQQDVHEIGVNDSRDWNSPDGEDQYFEKGEKVEIKAEFGWGFDDVSSTENTGQLEVLRNGDQAPGYEGSNNQTGVDEYLQNYINDQGKITIGESQAIYLFDGNKKGFPSWEENSDWWQEQGYHRYDQSGWFGQDQNSYEYWSESDYRRQNFVDQHYDQLPEDRDFQDLAVLLTLKEAHETQLKPTKIQYSKEAMQLVANLLSDNDIAVNSIQNLTLDYKTPNQSKKNYLLNIDNQD